MPQFTPEKFLDFVTNYDPKNPKHKAGMLEFAQKVQVLDPDLLSDEANWVRVYRTNPNPPAPTGSVDLNVPFFDQKDNGPEGWRQCQSSSIAMCLAYLRIGGITGDVQYVNIVNKYGDTTERQPHYDAMKALGYTGAKFSTTLSEADIKNQLNKGKPVVVGVLHHGSVSNPTGGGHFIVVKGYNDKGWIVNDPYGELDLVNGTWASQAMGAGKNQVYSYKNLNPRVFYPGPNDGWGWTFA
jgi:uncharacterized protein YvpB